VKEQGQAPGRTASGNRLDIAAAKKQCEDTAILIDEEALRLVTRYSPAAARSIEILLADLPAALEALEEARAEIERLGWRVKAGLKYERERDEARGLLREVVNAKPARLKAVMYAIDKFQRERMNITKCPECGCTKDAEDRVRHLERQLSEAQGVVEQEIQHKHGPWKCDPPCYSHRILAILRGTKERE